ncbi:MAG: ABC transporter permease [Deinococcales bacterium]
MSDVTLTPEPETAVRGRSLAQDALRRFVRHPTGVTGIAILVVFLLVTALAPVLRHQDPLRGNLRMRMLPPTWTMSHSELEQRDLSRFSYPMGTDALGRDILARVLYGGRISLRVGLEAVLMAAAVGTLLGLIAGYFGGWLDTFIVWFVDILLAFPGILLAIAIVAALGQSLLNALIAISITYVPVYIRIVRSVALGLRQTEYVQAARALGSRSNRIILAHVLPNGLSPLMVQFTLSIGTAILDVAALGFLGLGARPPSPEWGAMISDGFGRFRVAPWLSIFPGIAIFFSVVGFNLLGDAIRDVLDPRLRK